MDEVPLSGGRVTEGVVRVGDTVRRPVGSHSPFVHELLRHLESIEFPHAPRLLGLDDQRREILSYIEGWVPSDLGPFSDRQIQAAARIILHLHEATAGTELSGNQEVVCHGDLSPCNFVFRSDLPECLIDFDAAFAGPRRIDVGYAAWLWLDIGNSELDPRETGRRLGLFFEAYGPKSPTDPIHAITDAQAWLARRCDSIPSSFSRNVSRWAQRCSRWVRSHGESLEVGLSAGAA